MIMVELHPNYLSVTNFCEYYFLLFLRIDSKTQKLVPVNIKILMNIIIEFNSCALIQGARVRIQKATGFLFTIEFEFSNRGLFFFFYSTQQARNAKFSTRKVHKFYKPQKIVPVNNCNFKVRKIAHVQVTLLSRECFYSGNWRSILSVRYYVLLMLLF